MCFLKSRLSIVLFIFMIMFGTGCQKDEVLPSFENNTISEQTSEQLSTENGDMLGKTDGKITQDTIEDEKDEEENRNTNESTEKVEEESESNSETATQSEGQKGTSEKSNTATQKNNQPNTKTSDQEKQPTKAAPAPETAKKQESAAPKEVNPKNSINPTTDTNKPAEQTEPQSSIYISIIGDDQLGTILSSTKVVINNGDTVLTATQKILKQKSITISVRGSGASAYVEGIANLFEFDRGPLSGWTVTKNGVLLDRSAGVSEVKNGDQMKWLYTTDYEKDLKE